MNELSSFGTGPNRTSSSKKNKKTLNVTIESPNNLSFPPFLKDSADLLWLFIAHCVWIKPVASSLWESDFN